MKNILTGLFIIASYVSFGQAYVGQDGAIHPVGKFPVVVSNEAKGTIKRVKSLVERDAIPLAFRDTGMLCWVTDSSKFYVLSGGILNTRWVSLVTSAVTGGIANETDPLFSTSPAFVITTQKMRYWDSVGYMIRADSARIEMNDTARAHDYTFNPSHFTISGRNIDVNFPAQHTDSSFIQSPWYNHGIDDITNWNLKVDQSALDDTSAALRGAIANIKQDTIIFDPNHFSGLGTSTSPIVSRLKTINYQTLYGTGNINISGSSGGVDTTGVLDLVGAGSNTIQVQYKNGDTRNIIFQSGNKSDSLTVTHSATADTIKYWVNGTAFIGGIINKSAGTVQTVNGIAAVNGNVTVPIPNNNNQLINGAGYETVSHATATFQPIGNYVSDTSTLHTQLVQQLALIQNNASAISINAAAIATKLDSVKLVSGIGTDTLYNYVGNKKTATGYIDKSQNDGLLKGGQVTWSGAGLTEDVTGAYYYINGGRHYSPTGSVTLDPSDPALDRTDIIALNTSGQIVKITGVPSLNPIEPQPDPATQLRLTSIDVLAGSTTPAGVSASPLYNENASGEWAVAATGITADPNNTTAPFSGVKDLNIGAWTSGDLVTFTNTVAVSSTSYSAFKFFIRLKDTVTSISSVNIRFFNGTTAVSNEVSIINYGLNKNVVGSYQNISMPLSAFTFSSNDFNRIQIRFGGSDALGLYIDYVQLQSGINTTATTTGNFVSNVFFRNDSLIQVVNNKNILIRKDYTPAEVDAAIAAAAGTLQSVTTKGNTTTLLIIASGLIVNAGGLYKASLGSESLNGGTTYNGTLNLGDASGTSLKVKTAPLTSNRNILFPNKDGTVALLSDVSNAPITVTATGDATGTSTSSNTAPSLPLTLATVNSNTGTFGSGTQIPVLTVDAKGRITGVTTTGISGASGGTVTSIATNAATGITGGTITSTGTLSIDTTILSTSARANATYFPLTGGAITGTGGNGFIGLPAQSSVPSTPSVLNQKIYADASGRFTMLGANGFALSISKSHLTGSRILYAQDKDYTAADSATLAAETAARIAADTSKANNSNTVTVNGNTQTLGSNPSFTISGNAGTVTGGTIPWPGAIYVSPTIGTVNNGTLSFAPTLASQTANTVFAAPNGSNGTPSFRSLQLADLPAIPESGVTNLTSDLAGKLNSSFGTQGSVLFRGSSGISQSGSLSFDSTNLSLGIGKVPSSTLLGYYSGVSLEKNWNLNTNYISINSDAGAAASAGYIGHNGTNYFNLSMTGTNYNRSIYPVMLRNSTALFASQSPIILFAPGRSVRLASSANSYGLVLDSLQQIFIQSPPNGTTSDSVLVWHSADSSLRKIAPTGMGGGTGGSGSGSSSTIDTTSLSNRINAKADTSSAKTYFSVNDFYNNATFAAPLGIKTSAIDTAIAKWFRSLPGYVGDGSQSLRDNFTWQSSGSSQAQLATPTLTAGTPTTTTIPLSWTTVPNATGYNLYNSTDNTTFTNIYSGSATSYTASGLTANTLYYFRVNATATGLTTSNFGTTSATTQSGAYLTWASIGSAMEQYSANQGMRKMSTASSGWNTTTAISQASQTLASGEKLVVKVSTSPALATAIILSPSGTTPNEGVSPVTGLSYAIYSGYNLTSFAINQQNNANLGSSYSITAGDLLRISYSGTTITWEKSSNGGSSWTTTSTSTVAPSGTYNIWVQSYSALGGFDQIFKQ